MKSYSGHLMQHKRVIGCNDKSLRKKSVSQLKIISEAMLETNVE